MKPVLQMLEVMGHATAHLTAQNLVGLLQEHVLQDLEFVVYVSKHHIYNIDVNLFCI